MSCKHAEDVCQHCLEKVQTTTEDATPPNRVSKALTARQKRNKILLDSSLLAAFGAITYFNGKLFFEAVAMAFDEILDTIGTRTRKE